MYYENININLYSSQIGTLGLETMIKLTKLNIFIYGMRGIGVEVAKNLILAGPKSVTIFDNNICKINDLTANFYISEKDIENNTRRDYASLNNLLELNNNVQINIMSGSSILEHMQEKIDKKEKYDVVVFTEFISKKEIIKINNLCRDNEIGFIYGTELGINGFIFVDFGNNFKVFEKNNIDEKFIINSISNGTPGIITFSNSIKKYLRNGDLVMFKEIEGMNELNNCTPFPIRVINNTKIEIPDTSKFSKYHSGGYMIKAKTPLVMKFESFEKKLDEPFIEEDGFPNSCDFCKININAIIHLGIISLCDFYEKDNSLPKINNQKDAEELLIIAKRILIEKAKENQFWIKIFDMLKEEIKNFDEIFKKTITNLSFFARAQISPISSFLGGRMTQEIIKYTGKDIPIKQWFWCDFSETLDNLDIQ